MTPEETARAAHAWADALIDQLVDAGVTQFFIAPGSRSTPLTMAVARHPTARAFIHFDERGTAFMALGAARASGMPAAWITTSGTAVANGFPAVVEAATDAVPMILLTADRPPELRHTGANQTIDQVKIFGDYVRWFFDVPVPEADAGTEFARSTAAYAVERALGPDPGPVHLNCMFREPLAPPADYRQGPAGRTIFSSRSRLRPDEAALERVVRMLYEAARPLIVAGRMSTTDEPWKVAELAASLDVPFVADIGSQLRLGDRYRTNRLTWLDALLASGDHELLRPDLILHFGGGLVSKRITGSLAAAPDAKRFSIRTSAARMDPFHAFDLRIQAHPGDVAEELRTRAKPRRTSLNSSIVAPVAAAGERLATYFDGDNELSEPSITHHLSRLLPERHLLILGSSMPVRDMDTFAVGSGHAATVIANRGASGIDGTIATAVGATEAMDLPGSVLCGDLTLLHDLNSIAALAHTRRPIVVVVLNNDGGGIFSFLPISHHKRQFERYFGTPHGLGFEHGARMFNLQYFAPDCIKTFQRDYQSALDSKRSAVIEIRTNRARNVEDHRKLYEAVRR